MTDENPFKSPETGGRETPQRRESQRRWRWRVALITNLFFASLMVFVGVMMLAGSLSVADGRPWASIGAFLILAAIGYVVMFLFGPNRYRK